MKSIKCAALVAMAAVLVACGSSVKLDEANVSDAKPTVVQAGQAGAGTQASGSTAVKQVNLVDNKATGQAPLNLPQTIYFDFDSFVVKPEFQAAVEVHAKHLSRNKNLRVYIEGHTDERGGREYNLALGQKRAEAVRRALALLGAADAQVEAVSFGKEKPVDTGGSEESMAKNRRAQFSYR